VRDRLADGARVGQVALNLGGPLSWRTGIWPPNWPPTVQFPDGRLSTMANKVRAKDAALGHAAAILSGRAETAGSPAVARLDGEAA
jgi:hypothetical protein